MGCLCCGSDSLRLFLAPTWGAAGWSDVPVGECERCGSLITQRHALSEPNRSRWPVLNGTNVSATLLTACVNGRGSFSVPLVQGPVWTEYRDNWMAISPDEHRWIPTLDGLRLAAQSVGLVIEAVHGSCPVRHFVASELIARRIPPGGEATSTFSSRELAHLERKARRCGGVGRSPEATIVLRTGAGR